MRPDPAAKGMKPAEVLDELDRSIHLAIKGYLMSDTQNRKLVGGNIHSVSGTTRTVPGLGSFKACLQAGRFAALYFACALWLMPPRLSIPVYAVDPSFDLCKTTSCA